MGHEVVLKVSMERIASSNEDLLKNSHDVRIVKCLGSQSVNDSRDIHFTSREQRCKLMLNRLPRVLKQKVNIAAKAHFREDLQLLITFLDGFVNENTLSVQHLVVYLWISVWWVMPQDNCFVSFVDLSPSQNFYE